MILPPASGSYPLRVANIPEDKKPTVFIERAAGLAGENSCCKTFGNGNFGEFVAAAGGHNLGADWFKTVWAVR